MSYHIAIIDDDVFMAEFLRSVLVQQGCSVNTFCDARAALETLPAKWPDLILCDIMMPEMDGFQFIESLHKRHPRSAHIPIVLVSAKENRTELIKSSQLGVDGFISKPIDTEVLISTIFGKILVRDRIRANMGFLSKVQSEVSETDELRRVRADICLGIENSEFTFFYQPKINAHGDLCGAEALARWIRSDGSMIPPNTFVSIAEHYDLITPLTDSLLDCFVKDLSEWTSDGYNLTVDVAVNLSAVNLSKELVNSIFENLSGEAAQRISFEITESSIPENLDCIRDAINSAVQRGSDFYLDDFGTGYSSLAYLRSLPITGMKIDKAFVDQCLDGHTGLRFLEKIVSFGEVLELDVTAEGVENSSQKDVLFEMGCDELQGYLFSPAIPATQFAEQYLDRQE